MTEPVHPNELRAFFAYVIDVLERLGIPYAAGVGQPFDRVLEMARQEVEDEV